MATSATPSPADAAPVDGLDGIAEADDSSFGTIVTANTREERVIGEFVRPSTLEVGDDVFLTYRERRRTGGLRYTANGQSFTARVAAVDDEHVRIKRDFTGTEALIEPEGDSRGWPTLHTDDAAYAVKHCVRRQDTTTERTALVRVVENLRGAGVDTVYETDHGDGVPRVKAVVENATEYEQALRFADVFTAVEATPAFWSGLDAEYERKPSETVENHDRVWVFLKLRED